MKIVTKILLLVIIAVSIIMGGLNLLISNHMQQAVYAQIMRAQTTNLDFVERDLLRTTEYIQRTAEIIGNNRVISKALDLNISRGTSRILNSLTRIYPFFNYVLIVDVKGEVFSASTLDRNGNHIAGEQLLGLNIGANPMIRGNPGLRQRISDLDDLSEDVVAGAPGKDPYLELLGMKRGDSQWFLAPVRQRGNLIGWVVLSYNWERELSALLDEITRHLVKTGNATVDTLIVNPDNRVIAGSARYRREYFEPDAATLWQSRKLEIGSLPMQIIIANDRAQSLMPVVEARNILLVSGLTGALVLIFILYFLLRKILLLRLVKLYDIIMLLGSGKFASRMPDLGNDELGSLALAFNQMAESLQATTVSRDYMDCMFESVTEGIVTVDEKGLITTFNTAAGKLFGYDTEEIIGRNVAQLMAPEERENHISHVENASMQNSRIIGRNRVLWGYRKNGSMFPLELIITPLVQDGKGGFIGTIRDITERMQNEKKLALRSEELKRANSELERFVYVASHDLKAPMRGIDNLASWIEQDLDGTLDDETRENLTLLRGRVNRMEKLLDGLLEYSRIGRFDLEAEDTATREMLDDIVDYLSLPGGFSVEIPDDMPVLKTEIVSLEQVFRNLINNAVKHHDRDQGQIKIGWSGKAGYYEFTVADDGPGIAPEFHERVFTMFQTLKPRDEVEGSGLGLSMVKKEVEGHGGEIRIDSTAATRGTTFRFTWKESVDRLRRAG